MNVCRFDIIVEEIGVVVVCFYVDICYYLVFGLVFVWYVMDWLEYESRIMFFWCNVILCE